MKTVEVIVEYAGKNLSAYIEGAPVITVGNDMREIEENMKEAIELYLEAGIRGCEIGYLLADRDPITRQNRFNGLDLLRLAIPRRVYTDNHMDVIAAALKNVYDRRESITRGVHITWEAPLMRHFTVQLERLE